MTAIATIDRALGAFVRARGYNCAGYYLDEQAAALTDGPADHYPRRIAAKALQTGATVTVDLGYRGALKSQRMKSVRVTLRDLISEES